MPPTEPTAEPAAEPGAELGAEPEPAYPALVVLTGAGISRESGLHTFRDADGIWARHRIEDVATPEAFARDPARVHAFYNARRAALGVNTLAPNAAHAALARLERAWPGDFLLITQNVDNLHERAGSRRLLHMHGELARARCTACAIVSGWTADLSTRTRCPACGAAGRMRPHVVWFGEYPFGMEEAEAALAGAGLFMAIGTSGTVYPAAGFAALAREAGARTVELNLEPSETAAAFEAARYGRATEIVPAFVADLLAAHDLPG